MEKALNLRNISRSLSLSFFFFLYWKFTSFEHAIVWFPFQIIEWSLIGQGNQCGGSNRIVELWWVHILYFFSLYMIRIKTQSINSSGNIIKNKGCFRLKADVLNKSCLISQLKNNKPQIFGLDLEILNICVLCIGNQWQGQGDLIKSKFKFHSHWKLLFKYSLFGCQRSNENSASLSYC